MNVENIQLFTDYLSNKGYSKRVVQIYSRALKKAHLDWEIKNPQELFEHINKTRKRLSKLLPDREWRCEIGPATSAYFEMVTGICFREFKKQYTAMSSKYATILDEYFIYATEFRHVLKSSAEAERNTILRFLNFLECDVETVASFSAHELSRHISSAFKGLKPNTIGRCITTLRAFFRFLEYKGFSINQSVLYLPLTVASWGAALPPAILSQDEERRLRTHYDLADEKGIRNNIIIRLMLDLGLRCSEIPNLCLGDIRWNEGVIHLRRTKTKASRELPLPMELGKLLEEYVLRYRPKTSEQHLLLRKWIGRMDTPMTKCSVRRVVRIALEAEGITGWWKGTHTLRRTAASKMYNAGNGLKIVADFLGHKSLDSTKAYVKVDFKALEEIALAWPGEKNNE